MTPSCLLALLVSQSQCPAASRTFPREKQGGRPVAPGLDYSDAGDDPVLPTPQATQHSRSIL